MRRHSASPAFVSCLGLVAIFSCAPVQTSAPVAPAPAPVTVTVAPAPALPVPTHVTFIDDDYPRALALAKAQNKPLFIDAWAPWCHTCLSMRAYVFNDEAMQPLAGQFIWLAIDTEKSDNAAFVARYPMQFWPTLWVVNPKTEQPALKWLGSATAKELALLLVDAAKGAAVGTEEGEAAAALLRGKRASAEAKRADAVREYRAALNAAPPKWARRATTDEALIAELWAMKDDAACVTLAEEEMAKLPPGTSLANVALFGLQCAHRSPDGSTGRGLLPRMMHAVEQLALDPNLPILDDDRSGLFEEVVEERADAHDAAGAKALAASWATFLETRAKAATTPSARAVFDAHRLLAYIAVGDPARALPMLAQSEQDFPTDYNPPARMAKAWLELRKYDEAVAAIDRALSRGYGPRKVRLYAVKADILAAKGDLSGAARVSEEALAYGATLPAAERPNALLAELDKRRSLPRPAAK